MNSFHRLYMTYIDSMVTSGCGCIEPFVKYIKSRFDLNFVPESAGDCDDPELTEIKEALRDADRTIENVITQRLFSMMMDESEVVPSDKVLVGYNEFHHKMPKLGILLFEKAAILQMPSIKVWDDIDFLDIAENIKPFSSYSEKALDKLLKGRELLPRPFEWRAGSLSEVMGAVYYPDICIDELVAETAATVFGIEDLLYEVSIIPGSSDKAGYMTTLFHLYHSLLIVKEKLEAMEGKENV